MKKLLLWIFIIMLSVSQSGCAVYMALKQPSKKNLSFLSAGVSRENVITYIGAPVSSDLKDGERVEIYKFIQGYSGGVKASRALFHGIADLFTIFIWELIGTPAEAIADGTEMTVKVIYDQEDKIKDVIYLQGEI